MPTSLTVVKKFFPRVVAVVDANKCIQIEVTEADDKKATRKDHNTCAMAVACKRKFDCDGVIISMKTAYLIDGDVATRYTLPESVSREVVSFDRKGGFAPGRYQLSKVPPSLRLGQKEKKRHRTDGSRRVRELVHRTSGVRVVLGNKDARKK